MTTTTKPKPTRVKRTTVLGSVTERVKTRTNGSEYSVYRAQFYKPDDSGQRVEQTFSALAHGGQRKAEAAAHKWLGEQRTAILAGTWRDPHLPALPEPGDLTVAVVAAEWRQTWDLKLRPKTRQGYASLLEKRILPKWGSTRVDRIASRDVQAWITGLTKLKEGRGGQALNPQTIRNAYNVLRVMLGYAVRQGYVPTNPCTSDAIELPTKRRVAGAQGIKRAGVALSWAELRQLVDELPSHWRTPVDLATATGLRSQELWGLTRADWNPQAGTITVRQTLSDIGGDLIAGLTKTEASERTIGIDADDPLHAALCAAVASPGLRVRSQRNNWQPGYPAMITGKNGEVELGYVQDREDPRRLMFVTPTGSPVAHGNFRRRIFKPAVQRLWPEGHPLNATRFHDLRHSVGTLLLSETSNAVDVMKLLGHSQLSTTTDLYGRHEDAERSRFIAGRIGAARRGKPDELASKRAQRQSKAAS